MWWAVQTLTSLGYGDFTPVTIPGNSRTLLYMIELCVMQGISSIAMCDASVSSIATCDASALMLTRTAPRLYVCSQWCPCPSPTHTHSGGQLR